MEGLAALEARLGRGLELPGKPWVPEHPSVAGLPGADVAVIGTGMCDRTAAATLRRWGSSASIPSAIHRRSAPARSLAACRGQWRAAPGPRHRAVAFIADRTIHFDRLQAFATPGLLGDEWPEARIIPGGTA